MRQSDCTHKPHNRAIVCILVSATLFAIPAWSEVEEKAIRVLASSILKEKPSKAGQATCGIVLSRPSIPCAGPKPIEDHILATAKGTVIHRRFHSFAESADNNPGEFHGNLSEKEWQDLLIKLSHFKWIDSKGGAGGPSMPMPSHSDIHRELRISDGAKSATYSVAGRLPPGQDSISDAFAMVSGLAQRATDTAWSLGLGIARAKWQGGNLEVKVAWSSRGKQPIKIQLPKPGKPTTCGSLVLSWYSIGTEENPKGSMESDLFFDTLSTVGNDPGSWSEIGANDGLNKDFRFKVPGKTKLRRQGKLVHSGVQVKVHGASETMTVSLYSPWFDF